MIEEKTTQLSELIQEEKDIIDFILNGFLHITLLFIFLTALYYFIVSPLTQHLLHEEIGSLIDSIFNNNFPETIIVNNNNTLISYLNPNLLEKFKDNTFNINNNNLSDQYLLSGITNNYFNSILTPSTYSKLNQIKLEESKFINQNALNNLIESNSLPNDIITRNNQTVLYHTIYISFTLFLITIILLSYFKLNYPDDVNILHILLENFILFTIIGIIEYWFFTTYAFKYCPLLPSELLTLINTSIKNLLNVPYKYTDPNITPPFQELPIPIIFS